MKLFSVTEILSPWSNYGAISPDVLQAAAERGKRVHAACLAHITGAFLIAPLSESETLYLESFKAWAGDHIVKVIAVEKEYADKALGYHGHPDIVAVVAMSGRKERTVIDIKTPQQEQKTWGAQLSAYKVLTKSRAAMALMLDKSGGPARAIPYTEIPHYSIFLSALNCMRWFKS